MNTQSKPMDLLFCGNPTQEENRTPVPVGFIFASRHNRDLSPDGSQDGNGSNNDYDDHNMLVGNQPESSTEAARLAPNRGRAQGSRAVHQSHP